MRLSQNLIETFSDYVEKGLPVALVTVLSTSGSTYSKAGSQVLIGLDGSVHGLLSGGCLENDLAERAAVALQTGKTDWVEYDLRDDDDVFGLGVGCEGAMRLQILPLKPEAGYEPFAGWLARLESTPTVEASFDTGTEKVTVTKKVTVTFSLGRPYAVLVLGAGQDADPLLQFCRSLGWRVTLSDHRPAYVARMQERHDGDLRCIPVEELGERLDFDEFDAAIVMSHHLASDRQNLGMLAESSIRFIGLLGPPHRRDRLLDEMGDARHKLAGRLHSPVGRRIGGRGPAAIALEVAAELQAHFCALTSA
jgi:xanthine/CO dehydrogenase XdhC/CoxF family maturation factor